ncbi:hypothetical protein NLI96_g179 [Meripilus lineatus]|uniref:Helicase ATP-binding domain-containing protein n=1 Tax=Meripilus lineatus TaxID=2056292 RepID=A0AAD5VD59_9APHY|nr:hypothetical protein NLI96_g179 [Physisporinus lineatus]
MTQNPPREDLPTIGGIRQRTLESLGHRPCLWQCESTLAILKGGRDVVCISGTGSGKTLTFWMPLLFRDGGIQVVITPLNILGEQNRRQLQRLGISAIAINGDTATPENLQEIMDLKHRVVVVNPEIAFKDGGSFGRVWKNQAFTSKIISIIWDEGHCVNRATVKIIHRSNDRPNIYLTVQKIRHSLTSFKDLDFLIPQGWKPGERIPKFLVFFDNITESIKAAKALKARLPLQEQSKIKWFNSDDTPELREYLTEVFREQGEGPRVLYGLYCTDSFGMGVDIADIEIVVQW